MPAITRKQREAIKRIFDRDELVMTGTGPRGAHVVPSARRMTYREFRKTVQHGYDCLMVQWCGIWLGVEKDGYVHS